MNGAYTSFHDGTSRVLKGPDGATVATPTTKTGGVNEGIALAVASLRPFKCHGHEPIQCTEPIKIPAAGRADIDLGCTVFEHPVENPCFSMMVDSFNGGRLFHKGNFINYGNAGILCYMGPVTPDPVYGQKIIQNADIQLGDFQAYGTVAALAYLDLSSGEIFNNQHLDFLRLSGWNGAVNKATDGFTISKSSEEHGFNENHIRIGQCMGFSRFGVRIGTSSTGAIYLSDNYWDLNINSFGYITSAVETYGSFDYIQMCHTQYGGGSGVPEYAMILRPGSRDNRYHIRQHGTLYGVSDSGANNGGYSAA